MYQILLSLHSFTRWLVLAALLFTIYRSYTSWRKKAAYTRFDEVLRLVTTNITHIQMCLGLYLYFVSPISQFFIKNLREGLHLREIRFFGMEHITMMLAGIIVITIGSGKAKRTSNHTLKFKIQAIWFGIGLLIILTSIPWPFSPLVHRPWIRPL